MFEAPTEWDISAWGLAASIGFGVVGCWLSRRTATRQAARDRARYERRELLLRLTAEILKLEKCGFALTDARRRQDAAQIAAILRYWCIVTMNVRTLSRTPVGFDARRADELRCRIAAAQAQCELSRSAIARGHPPTDATADFHRSARRLTDIATELRAAAEQMLDGA